MTTKREQWYINHRRIIEEIDAKKVSPEDRFNRLLKRNSNIDPRFLKNIALSVKSVK